MKQGTIEDNQSKMKENEKSITKFIFTKLEIQIQNGHITVVHSYRFLGLIFALSMFFICFLALYQLLYPNTLNILNLFKSEVNKYDDIKLFENIQMSLIPISLAITLLFGFYLAKIVDGSKKFKLEKMKQLQKK